MPPNRCFLFTKVHVITLQKTNLLREPVAYNYLNVYVLGSSKTLSLSLSISLLKLHYVKSRKKTFW